jgi:hypothetical protein
VTDWVFSVNAKNHPHKSIWVGGDTILVNGDRCRTSATAATRPTGQPACSPSRPASHSTPRGSSRSWEPTNGYTVKKQPKDGTVVVQRKRISQFLQARPSHLTIGEIDAIYNVARRSTTWR